jgi:hypothetical protein
MVSAIRGANPIDPTAGATQTRPMAKPATSSQKTTESQSQTPTRTSTDTVHITSAAQAGLQESIETPAQTAKEASGGDHQAQRLLAKEAVAVKTK